MEILERLGMEVIQDHRPERRQALDVQLGEFFDFVHCLSALSTGSIVSLEKEKINTGNRRP
jgi:hypothetical protein